MFRTLMPCKSHGARPRWTAKILPYFPCYVGGIDTAPKWTGQRPWFEIWFAVLLDENRRRALWLRNTLFVPKQGDATATVWGAWFDADALPARAAKHRAGIDQLRLADAALIRDRFRKAELLVSSYATSGALLHPGDVVEVDAGPAGHVRARLGV